MSDQVLVSQELAEVEYTPGTDELFTSQVVGEVIWRPYVPFTYQSFPAIPNKKNPLISIGLAMNVYDPDYSGGTFDPYSVPISWIPPFSFQSYSHEIDKWGYKSATVTIYQTPQQIEDWLENGLGRHVVFSVQGGFRIFEGFTNHISVSRGGLSLERGKLMDISNRVSLVYTPVYYDISPPATGTQRETPLVNDTESQGKFGIFEKVVSGGQASTDDIERFRDQYLNDTKHPETNRSFSLGGTDPGWVTLEVLGYRERWKTWIYNNNSTAAITIGDKITQILTADPIGITNLNQSQINPNLYLTNEFEDKNRNAFQILSSLINLGTSSDVQTILTMGDDRQVSYREIPSQLEYIQALSSSSQQIQRIDTGEIVFPWQVLPTKWIFFQDFLPGRSLPITVSNPADFRDDPRVMFIDTVTYSAPWELSLNGIRVSTIPQAMAKLGLGGI